MNRYNSFHNNIRFENVQDSAFVLRNFNFLMENLKEDKDIFIVDILNLVINSTEADPLRKIDQILKFTKFGITTSQLLIEAVVHAGKTDFSYFFNLLELENLGKFIISILTHSTCTKEKIEKILKFFKIQFGNLNFFKIQNTTRNLKISSECSSGIYFIFLNFLF
jgi:hypothetical protein